MSAAVEINPAVAVHIPWTVVRVLPPAIAPYRMCDYIADCPNHLAGNRALSVRIADDTPTVACDYGCVPSDIWRAVGIDPDDVRGSLVRWASAPPPEPSRHVRSRASPALVLDRAVMETAVTDLEAGRALDDTDARRLALAIRRVVREMR